MGAIMLNPGMTSHPSILALPRRARWPWFASICWLSENSRRDTFPKASAKTLFEATSRDTKALIHERLWVDEGTEIYVPQWVDSRYGRPVQLWKFAPLDGTRPHIPDALRLAVYERDGFACLHCGATENLSLDHIHPYSLGGEDTFDNLQTLCRSCNSKKGARV